MRVSMCMWVGESGFECVSVCECVWGGEGVIGVGMQASVSVCKNTRRSRVVRGPYTYRMRSVNTILAKWTT